MSELDAYKHELETAEHSTAFCSKCNKQKILRCPCGREECDVETFLLNCPSCDRFRLSDVKTCGYATHSTANRILNSLISGKNELTTYDIYWLASKFSEDIALDILIEKLRAMV